MDRFHWLLCGPYVSEGVPYFQFAPPPAAFWAFHAYPKALRVTGRKGTTGKQPIEVRNLRHMCRGHVVPCLFREIGPQYHCRVSKWLPPTAKNKVGFPFGFSLKQPQKVYTGIVGGGCFGRCATWEHNPVTGIGPGSSVRIGRCYSPATTEEGNKWNQEIWSTTPATLRWAIRASAVTSCAFISMGPPPLISAKVLQVTLSRVARPQRSF